MGEVVGFNTGGVIGDGIKLNPDDILDANKGSFECVVIVGQKPDGEICVCGTESTAETLMLLAWAQNFLVTNVVGRL